MLFADVHGYSRMMGEDEERTVDQVTRSVELFKGLAGDYGGRILNVMGDGVLSVFPNALEATKFAIEVQREFDRDQVWRPPNERVEFRIGINIGQVIEAEGNVHGNAVNIAARLEELATPGVICVTDAVFREISEKVSAEIRDVGAYRLKNIAGEIEVYEVDPRQRVTKPPRHRISPSATDLWPVAVAPPVGPSIAVLPLRNNSGDPSDDHLCDGLTEDLIGNLTRFRDLTVIAPHSAFIFRDSELSTSRIGSELGVRYLLTGSVRRRDRRIRISIKLMDAPSSRSVWANRYNGDLADVFEFQDDITNLITGNLAVQIDSAERHRALETQPKDLRAYGLILRGQHLLLRFRRDSNLHARRLFESAAELDPSYARSYAAMSRTYNLEWRYAWVDDPTASLDKAVELARMAITRDEQDARGYAELGYALLYKRDFDGSLEAYDRAVKLNPNDADLLAEMGDLYVYLGESHRGIELVTQAMQLNPFYPDWYLWYLGDAFFQLDDYERTIKTVSKMGDLSQGHRLLAASYALLGDDEQARYHANQVMEVQPNFSLAHWRHVPPVKNPEDLERFIEGLRKAGLK